jgi:S-DNA-T family DNA segregation ATPase FtsK/SpoIIIE
MLGLIELTVGLLLAACLVSHDPADPSFLHRPAVAAGVRNWIGGFGAQLSAFLLGFAGLAAFVAPLLLLGSAVRRLRRPDLARVAGRTLGVTLLSAVLPGLLQLGLGNVPWRGETLAAGGAFGVLLADGLVAGLAPAGSWLLLVALAGIGAALAIQSTLAQTLARWRQALAARWEARRLARARAVERKEKDQARERVVQKHLQRAVEEREGSPAEGSARPASGAASAAGSAGSLPLRVREVPGDPGFSFRKVKAAVPAGGEETRPVFDWPASASASAGREARAATAAAPRKPTTPRRQEEFSFAAAAAGVVLPPVNLLQTEAARGEFQESDLIRLGEAIRARCTEFGVEGTVEAINPGPVITVFEFQPAPGVKVAQIVNLQDDLALALRAESIRIDRIPGRSTLGIEVPNKQRATIRLGHLLAQEAFQKAPSVLTMAIGTTISGEPFYADLATMPHLLVAGATGSGKSVGLQGMITSILYKASREQVQFIFIDPKRIELGVYADIPHLKTEVVVEPKKAANALRWAVGEMERRYRLLAEVHVRSIEVYNRAIGDPEVQKRLDLTEGESVFRPEDFAPLPYYVIVIDELADLMMTSSAEVEAAIARLAQMARAVGIHLIVATQRPSVDVLTGTIKANFPCRMAFATASRHDSRTILDQIGSEKLLGKGDMLFMPPGSSRLLRLHGAYVSEQETAALIRWLKKQGRPNLDLTILHAAESERGAGEAAASDDELYDEAARLVVAERQASASFLQRRMRIGFSRAARLVDMMERDGLLGPAQGSKPRDVLVKPDYFGEIDRADRD